VRENEILGFLGIFDGMKVVIPTCGWGIVRAVDRVLPILDAAKMSPNHDAAGRY
jgi:hypothetical protein